MAFTPVVAPLKSYPKSQSLYLSELQSLRFLILNTVSLSSWLLIGGALQTLLAFFLPPHYILLPTLAILFGRLAYALLVTFHLLPNPYLKDALLYRVSAQVPDTDGHFSDIAASEKVVCFHLGAKWNHPLGAFAPNVKEIGDRLTAMNKELDRTISNNGYLGGSTMYNVDPAGSLEVSFISYWRSIEAIHEFAYGPLHRDAWDWWNSLTEKESKHMGINHEIFSAEPGQWEAIYVNHQPTMLGATTYLRKGDKLVGGTVEDQWIRGLMDARKGKLRSSAGRLGWQPERLYEKYERVPTKVASGYEG
jgi:Domain of unknown function (DUF4188)